MKDERRFNKDVKRIRRALLGGPLTRVIRRGVEKTLERVARNPRVPYELKRRLASGVRASINAERERFSGVAGVFYDLLSHPEVPVHLHQNELDGVRYTVWETISDEGEDKYTVLFPDIMLPDFYHDPSLKGRGDKCESDVTRLDSVVESLWSCVLYESPIFRNVECYKRPRLKNVIHLESVPHEGIPSTVCVPTFDTDSLADANAKAREIVRAYNRRKEGLGRLLELLKTDRDVRREFLDKHAFAFDFAELLKKYGLPIDILPNRISRTDAVHDGVPYRLYEMTGGYISGENEHQFWGFVHGIQFHDFGSDSALTERDRAMARDTLADVIFHYALYSEPHFRPEGGIIDNPAPLLIGNKRDEAMIAQISGIPDGTVAPFVRTYDRKLAKKDIETTIHAYNRHKESIHGITEKLRTDSRLRTRIRETLGHNAVHNNVDGVADVLGSYGARFIVENPYYLERKKEFEDSLSEADQIMGRILRLK